MSRGTNRGRSITRRGPGAVSDSGLEIEAMTVVFGGLTAVRDLTLTAEMGTVTGLIGPNGAGKTTTFNATTGNVTPASGSVRLRGHRLDGQSANRRAQRGLGRTFQRTELVESMTVAENVALGRELLLAGKRPWMQLAAPPGERSDATDRAEREIDRCGLASLRHKQAGDLSTGERRLVELARVLACGFDFLLLDEPSSGLDVAETRAFGEVLLGAVTERGIGILLVEHDMALVRQLCTRIYVMDFGTIICQGEAAEVLSADIVRTAYLGADSMDLTSLSLGES